MNRWYVTTFFTVIASAAPGCGKSNEPVDLGNHNTRSLGAKLSDYAGVWEGYAEAFAFDDGGDKIRLSLDADGEGTIEVGASPALPPPDADHNYPPNAVATLGVVSGFAYPVQSASVAAERIKFMTNAMEIYREWCGLLTPHAYVGSENPGPRAGMGGGLEGMPTSYSCWPLAGRRIEQRRDGCRDLDEEIEVPCGPSICSYLCACTETTCAVRSADDEMYPGLRPVSFDGALTANGQLLEGTLVLPSNADSGGTRLAIRMTRQ